MPSLRIVCLILPVMLHAAEPALAYPIVDTGQTTCYDNRSAIPTPKADQPFFGQDAQFPRSRPGYAVAADGLTVTDAITGLTWQRSPDRDGDGRPTAADKLTLEQARALPARLNAQRFGGFADWRLPSIKELYSLILFTGVDPSGPDMTATTTPFIDTRAFVFAYGDTAKGERTIDAQYASATVYTGPSLRGSPKLFGVNFADGRIKGYDLRLPGRGTEKTFFTICVRGNERYGRNDLHDNGDGTITDRATGLMWSKADSGTGMDWGSALAWVQARNAARHLGHDDWRLPNAKELQSIVDYGRGPDAGNTAAIDPVFSCTAIVNEAGKVDWPYYWSSTTHAAMRGGENAVYLAFGRAAGWPSGMGGPGGRGPGGPPEGAAGAKRSFVDVHGAGAQRSDPKNGDPAAFPTGRGPQGDVVRIRNVVRCVRWTSPR